jgi:phenylalanyl-tRNA synthetase beta chain
VRNRARGFSDLVLHTVEQVVLPHAKPVAMPDPDVADRPTDADVA